MLEIVEIDITWLIDQALGAIWYSYRLYAMQTLIE